MEEGGGPLGYTWRSAGRVCRPGTWGTGEEVQGRTLLEIQDAFQKKLHYCPYVIPGARSLDLAASWRFCSGQFNREINVCVCVCVCVCKNVEGVSLSGVTVSLTSPT